MIVSSEHVFPRPIITSSRMYLFHSRNLFHLRDLFHLRNLFHPRTPSARSISRPRFLESRFSHSQVDNFLTFAGGYLVFQWNLVLEWNHLVKRNHFSTTFTQQHSREWHRFVDITDTGWVYTIDSGRFSNTLLIETSIEIPFDTDGRLNAVTSVYFHGDISRDNV